MQNKLWKLVVMVSDMKTTEKDYYDFGSKSKFQYHFNFSEEDRSFKKFESQQFIVPWQMNKLKKNEILVE